MPFCSIYPFTTSRALKTLIVPSELHFVLNTYRALSIFRDLPVVGSGFMEQRRTVSKTSWFFIALFSMVRAFSQFAEYMLSRASRTLLGSWYRVCKCVFHIFV